jgi:Bacterial Ig-like domain (group 3)
MKRALVFCFVCVFATYLAVPAVAESDAESSMPRLSLKLISSNNPSSYGDPVDFTATLPDGTAGTVAFQADSVVLATVPITHGQANFRTSQLSLGEHNIRAVFNRAEDEQVWASLNQTVHQADPSVELYCNPNWSIFGEQLECEAVLPFDATGSVVFHDERGPLGKIEPAQGSARFLMPRLNAGSHLLTASFSGDTNYLPSNGRQTQTILQAGSDVNLYCSPAPAFYFETITCFAEVAPYATGAVIVTDGGLVVGEFPLLDGVAVWSVPSMDVGYHRIGASYAGDVNYRESNSFFVLNVLDPDTLTP